MLTFTQNDVTTSIILFGVGGIAKSVRHGIGNFADLLWKSALRITVMWGRYLM